MILVKNQFTHSEVTIKLVEGIYMMKIINYRRIKKSILYLIGFLLLIIRYPILTNQFVSENFDPLLSILMLTVSTILIISTYFSVMGIVVNLKYPKNIFLELIPCFIVFVSTILFDVFFDQIIYQDVPMGFIVVLTVDVFSFVISITIIAIVFFVYKISNMNHQKNYSKLEIKLPTITFSLPTVTLCRIFISICYNLC